jgi:hypothetical protein
LELDITIREYRSTDLEPVLGLVRELEAEMAEKFKTRIKSGLEDYRKRYLNPANKYKTWVAEVDNKVIGYARQMGFKEIYACIAKWNDPELRVIRSLRFHSKDLGYRYRLSLKLEDAESAPAEKISK